MPCARVAEEKNNAVPAVAAPPNLRLKAMEEEETVALRQQTFQRKLQLPATIGQARGSSKKSNGQPLIFSRD